MRVVIASDKFKGSLSSAEVANHLATGLAAANGNLHVDQIQVADGGEGTVAAVINAGYVEHVVRVSGPTGLPVEAAIAIRGNVAVIEMATASGLALLPDGIPSPLRATSKGTGELIRAAMDKGCNRIILGAGGSACTDGGAGLLEALGAEFLDTQGQPLPPGGAALRDLATIDLTGLDRRLRRTRFVLASDVDNPLLGANGAAQVFGPQKGATKSQVPALEDGLAQLVHVLEQEIGPRAQKAAAAPGAGAAGGLGYAAIAIFAARRESGIKVVHELVGLDRFLAEADLVITGEGSLDKQSLGGKTPFGISQAAAHKGIPVVAVCGRTTLETAQLNAAGFSRIYALQDMQPDLSLCMAEAGVMLEAIGKAIGGQMVPQPA